MTIHIRIDSSQIGPKAFEEWLAQYSYMTPQFREAAATAWNHLVEILVSAVEAQLHVDPVKN